MLMPGVIKVVMAAAVGAAFRLKGGLQVYKIRSEALKHYLDHMVGPNAKTLIPNFSREMSVSQMPGKTHKLTGIFMPDFDNSLRSGLHF
jgi:hypothetical protein